MEEIKQEIKKQKPKKERMSQDDAFKLIDEWSEFWEVSLSEDDFDVHKQVIWQAVRNERLTFNESDETFTYVLKKPIKDIGTGQDKYTILKIAEQQLGNKKPIAKYKDDIDSTVAMFQVYCSDSDGEEMQHGFLSRLFDRDMNIIKAIILGFFVQTTLGA
jgi:hypothetical protein